MNYNTEEVYISPQNVEQSFLRQLLGQMSQLFQQGAGNVDDSQVQFLVQNIVQEFININPEPISADRGITIKWSEQIPDENGVLMPVEYEISFGEIDLEVALSKSRPKMKDTLGHLATYRKIKTDDPLVVNGEICSICHEEYRAGLYKRVLDKCGHAFHKKCVDKWFVHNPSLECPLCRMNYSVCETFLIDGDFILVA